ncbi:hypothetical protein EKO27_g3484 [Xylaria grammica]|uniref:DUF7918 domain-containing protein n=1 Tax=Xylaria grammica TaxID=363999 RepID=A0A439DB92_9PEZI|nr:hypothetical protein EKO27_g3484 [Xylaria grammica]
MAIIHGLPGLEVTIYTNDGTTKEYDDPSGAGSAEPCLRAVTKYIECKNNEPFGIRLKATKEYSWGFKNHVLKISAVIDGSWVKGELCRQEDVKEGNWERDIYYRVAKIPSGRPRYIFQEFAFSKLTKVDGPISRDHGFERKGMERLGIIEVKVYRSELGRGKGAMLIPAGDHPKDFTVPREAAEGKSQSHRIKFTHTRPAMRPKYINCSKLTEDSGPIAIFRFKYRSRESLSLEGITLEPQDPLDRLVDTPDGRDGNSKNCDSGLGLDPKPPSSSRKIERKVDEVRHSADNISSPSNPKASHSNSVIPSTALVNEHSLLSNVRPPRSRVQQSVNIQNNAKAKIPRKGMIENCPRITHPEAERAVDDLIREICASSQPRLVAIKLESEGENESGDSKPPPRISASKRPLDKAGSQNKFQQSPFSISEDDDKNKPQKPSIGRVDDNHSEDGVAPTQGISTPRILWSCDTTTPSIEKDVSVPRIKTTTNTRTKTEANAKLESKNTITKNMGETIVHDYTRKHATKNGNRSAPQHLRISDPEAQSAKKLPPNTKRDKSHFVHDEHRRRGIKRLRGVRREFYRVANGVPEENRPSNLISNVYSPTQFTPPSATRVLNPNKSRTATPIPTPTHASTSNGATSTASLGSAPGLGSPSAVPDRRVGHKEVVAKRKFDEIIGGPTHFPRALKISESVNRRELVDLADSD